MALNIFNTRIPWKAVRDTSYHAFMADWVLPHWYERQNNPAQAAYAVNGNTFYNITCRSWTVLYSQNMNHQIYIDRYGVIYISKLGISLEIWVHNGEDFYHPGLYDSIQQIFDPGYQILETNYTYPTGGCSIRLMPETAYPEDDVSFEISLKGRTEDDLKQQGLYIVIRPFDNNGLSKIRKAGYQEKWVLVNGSKLLFVEKEPKQCFFANGEDGDVTKYFQYGEGNSGVYSKAGFCSGLIGYSGLPIELENIKFAIITHDRSLTKHIQFLINKMYPAERIDLFKKYPIVQANEPINQLIASNLGYLRVFCGLSAQGITISQIFVLNRFGGVNISRYYLRECFKRVSWDGRIALESMEPEQLIIAAVDYWKITGDIELIKNNWALLRKIAERLWYQEESLQSPDAKICSKYHRLDGFFESYFWRCAALKSLVELVETVNWEPDIPEYKERYLYLWSRLMRRISDAVKQNSRSVIPYSLDGRFGGLLVRNLAAAYPLQLWERSNYLIGDLIQYITKHHLYQGGVFSPKDFQGIDLALTAKFGQVLIREGIDYSQVFKYLLEAASDTWSWPDRIHPVTKEGVGKNGHDPEVLYQILLMLRNIFFIEEGDKLNLLPGIFNTNLWEWPQIKVQQCPSFFGILSFSCYSIHDIIQIEFTPVFKKKPHQVLLYANDSFQILYCDAKIIRHKNMIEIDADFHKIRLKRTQY